MTGFQADRSIRNLFLRHLHHPFITGLFHKGPQPDGRCIRRQHPDPVSALITVGAALFIAVFVCTAGACAVRADKSSDAEKTQSAPPVTESGQGQNLYTENEWGFAEGSMDVSHGIPEDAIGRLERIRWSSGPNLTSRLRNLSIRPKRGRNSMSERISSLQN